MTANHNKLRQKDEVSILGRQFGRLTAEAYAGSVGWRRTWIFRCTCGQTLQAAATDVRRGKITRCKICSQAQKTEERKPEVNRFWDKVDTSGDCWIWTGAKDKAGYGFFRKHDSNQTRAHIVVMQWSGQDIPHGMEVCHHCDNPSCVRLDHLFLGTRSQNQIDSSLKGRRYNQRLTADDVMAIRASALSNGEIAKELGMSAIYIAGIRRRVTWRHLP